MAWHDGGALAELEAKGRLVARADGRRILLLKQGDAIHACANRCPHEGYPLSEGTLADGHMLTCNWHNWKFDLDSGATLVGGDTLRRYATRVENGRVMIDVPPVDKAAETARVLAGVEAALADEDYQRLARETARLEHLGADEVDAVRRAVRWSSARFEYGMSHAFAAAGDWLALRERARPDEAVAAIAEILGHIAEDVSGGTLFPYAEGADPWSAAAFLAAVEAEDEAAAIRLLRGALEAGMGLDDLLPVFVEAALAHYLSFGHGLIYTVKAAELIRRLGPDSAAAVLLPLTRMLVYGTREDLLPEFRGYRESLEAWGRQRAADPPAAEALRKGSVRAILATVSGWGAAYRPQVIMDALSEAVAWNMLHADAAGFDRLDRKLDDSVGWLDFTHGITFADAARRAIALRPDLAPAALLQVACFAARNLPYVNPDLVTDIWQVHDAAAFLAREAEALFDHGRARFIVSAHVLKTLMAGAAEAKAAPAARRVILAALNRFIHAPIKERHVLRTARQMRAFVAEE